MTERKIMTQGISKISGKFGLVMKDFILDKSRKYWLPMLVLIQSFMFWVKVWLESFFSNEFPMYENAESLTPVMKFIAITAKKMIIESQTSVSTEEEPRTRSSTCIEYIGSARLKILMMQLKMRQCQKQFVRLWRVSVIRFFSCFILIPQYH